MKLRDHAFKIFYSAADDRLHDFYIRALSASVRYDRSAGFFSSSALAIAAAGVARLIQNSGKMRLLVGAQLSPQDVAAIEQGHDLRQTVASRLLERFHDPVDALQQQRLKVLAWMIADGTLEIKVVLPTDAYGRPLPAEAAAPYFHAKSGIFTDAQGDQVAFNGSVNESETAWQHNYEDFAVFTSWNSSPAHLAEIQKRFERLWQGQEPNWLAMDIPEAARQKLLKYRPGVAPTRDPLERQPEPTLGETVKGFTTALDRQCERAVLNYLHDAPHLLNSQWLGAATSAITPWPHQAQVAGAIVSRFPERFLLCDEVGLGKTIEAGLALRQLLLSGYVRRALILAPKSVCRQWQEELYEKFALNLPFFDGHVFRDVFGQETIPTTSNPWDAAEVFIASSQLAKRRERQQELLAARPWDAIFVDEAHHARRKDFLNQRLRRPNRLLELLEGREGQRGLKERTQSLMLMTATPMQVHPVEVWDLLRVLGLGGRWGASDQHFLRFFRELRQPFDSADWPFVLAMVRDYLETGGELDPALVRQAQTRLGLVEWEQLKGWFTPTGQPEYASSVASLKQLSKPARAATVELARHHTPLRRYLFRHTRRLLRDYVKRGLLRATVPRRDPQPVWIALRPEEQELYRRIEEYVSQFYQKYEQERKGLGFIMTVYRRRLTSSFYAVRCSLERRLTFLRGQTPPNPTAGADDDDLEQDDLLTDIAEELADEANRSRFRDEIEYVEDFLASLHQLGGNDSKVERLLADLEQMFKQHETVLIFTQYTDTMDFLRQQLRQVYGSQVACYSGRGGEVWNGLAWVSTSKEEIKNDFRRGETLKILLCTEAASEGLNLQTCGVLFNYDMPWNPMRVEQRIGRIDRIGGQPEVKIRHYFYENTVEAKIYQALENRIGWFENVVGELQPILARLGQAIQTVAMTPQAGREQALAQALNELRSGLDDQPAETLDLEQYLSVEEASAWTTSPLTLDDLERVLTQTSALVQQFQPHPTFQRAYLLQTETGQAAVTFDANLFDDHPYTLRLLTYGSEPFAALLEFGLGAYAQDKEGKQILRCQVDSPLPARAYYWLEAKEQPQRINHLADLEKVYADQAGGVWSDEAITAAKADFEGEISTLRQRQAQVVAARQRAERLALVEQARQTLLQAALIELAMGQQPDLFAQEVLPMAFTEAAITGLKRHKYPFAPLLKLVPIADLRPSPTDPFYVSIQGQSKEALKRQFQVQQERAAHLVKLLVNAPTQENSIPEQADMAMKISFL
ncbi:MAG: DEAD/DEAH box helicase family protein [Anaerolineae bacterium]|nr:DEAD/DEAH box helicase family protein [Anaerolineae bacterium]